MFSYTPIYLSICPSCPYLSIYLSIYQGICLEIGVPTTCPSPVHHRPGGTYSQFSATFHSGSPAEYPGAVPPRRPGWDRRQTFDVVTRWALCLIEPLMPLRRLIRLDEELAEATIADPELVTLVFAGVTADVVRTLPSGDSWRTVVLLPALADDQGADRPTSALLTPPGAVEAPPEYPGSREGLSEPSGGPLGVPLGGRPAPCWPSGVRFGTVRDAADVVEHSWSSPERNPALAPLADELSPAAARVLISAFSGWRAAWEETRAVVEACIHQGFEGQPPHEVLTDALRWACWRRRAYGPIPTEDIWPWESVYHWAWRGILLFSRSEQPDEAKIDRDIAWHHIADK